MKITLKFSSDLACAIGASACVFIKEFSFCEALLLSINAEGSQDHLDGHNFSQDSPAASRPSSPQPSTAQSSPESSPPSSPPNSAPPTPLPTPTEISRDPLLSSTKKRKKARNKTSSKMNCAKKRREEGPKDASRIASSANRIARLAGSSIETQFSMDDAPVASTVYEGSRGEGGRKVWRLDELVGPKAKEEFRLIKAVPGSTIPIVDNKGQVYALVVYPNDPSIKQAAQEAAELLRDSRSACSFSAKQMSSRRGTFSTLNAGIAHGNGHTHPQSFCHNKANTAVLDTLVESAPFQRLSGFATGVFKTWAPRLYDYCERYLERLLRSDSSLVRLFANSVLPAAAFNFGPRTVCLPHIDFSNLPFNWCWIWALGWYNWLKGGHIVLWDLKVVIEFPPGSLVAIPSGVCCHSNTHIQRNEQRYSFTQFAPGANFRWVDNGFKVQETPTQPQPERWEMGLGLFSTLEELGLKM